MPKKQLSTYDLLKELSQGLRERADTIGLDNYKPMPMQARFHKTDTQGRLFSGGNRAGKTVAGVVESVKWLTGNHEVFSDEFPPPVRGRICGVSFDQSIDLTLVPEVKKWMDSKYLINGRWEDSYHKATRTLTLVNGSTCEFMSYDQDVDKFASTSRHFIHFDEEPPKAIFTECLARLIDTNGRWWMTMTPLIEFSWTAEDLYEPIKDGKIPFISLFEASTRDNVHIQSDAIDKLTFIMDKDEREARTTGSGYAESTLIFPELKNNIIPPVGPEDLEGYKFFTTLDHGLRNPTAILLMAVGPDDDILVIDEYYQTDRLVGENAKCYKEWIESYKKLVVDYMVGDPSTKNKDPITGTSIRQEYGEHGVWYMLGNNDVRAGLLRVKSCFESGRLKITSNCVNTIREARTYKWKKPISSKVAARSSLMEEPVKKNDHAMDALRYGIMTLPKTYKEEEEDLKARLSDLGIDFATTSDVFDISTPSKEFSSTYFDEHLGVLD